MALLRGLPVPADLSAGFDKATLLTAIAAVQFAYNGTIYTPVQANAGGVPKTVLEAGENHVGQVGGAAIVSRVEKTRPADTTGYSIYDTIADSTSAPTSWDFALGRVALGSGVIVAAVLGTDNAANVAQIELDLYDDAITSTNDNAEAIRTYSGLAKYLGTLTFPALAKPTTNSTLAQASLSGINLPYKCVSSNLVRGRMRTLTAFTPASGAKYYVALFGLPD